MPNVFNYIKPKANIGRNVFDLSSTETYSQKVGQIDVVKVIDTIPGDHHEIELSDFTQTMPLNTAAFVTGRKELAAYFVPYVHGWRQFSQYMATREDPVSSALGSINTEPRTNLATLYLIAIDQYCYFYLRETLKNTLWMNMQNLVNRQEHTTNYFSESNRVVFNNYFDSFLKDQRPFVAVSSDTVFGQQNMYAYIDAYGYNTKVLKDIITTFDTDDWNEIIAFTSSIALPTGAQFLETFNKNVSDDVRMSYYGVNSQSSNFYYRDVYVNKFGLCWFSEAVRKLDMCGFGNLYQYVSLHYQILEKINNASSIINAAEFQGQVIEPLTSIITFINDNYRERYVNLYPLLAYNQIYYNFFRNSYYELSEDYNVRNFNVDYIGTSNHESNFVQCADLPVQFLQLGYHQYKKDMFTAVLPDTQFGAVSTISFDSSVTDNDNGYFVTTPIGQDGLTIPPYQSNNFAGFSSSTNSKGNQNLSMGAIADFGGTEHWISHNHNLGSFGFDMLALRRAEALQGYRQTLMRAGNRTADIMNAIYGKAPFYHEDAIPYFLDAVGADINVDPVVQTSASTGDISSADGKLGDLGARIYMQGKGSKIKFDCRDFGCIVILSYIVPNSSYNSYMLNPHRANLTPEQHYIPDFANLGMEPVINEYLNNMRSSSLQNTIRGYVPSYFEFKTDVDRVHGAFADFSANGVSSIIQGSLSHWVAPRTDLQFTKITTLAQFYIDPRILDNIFIVEADETQDTDQFICRTHVKDICTRYMPVLGLPQF